MTNSKSSPSNNPWEKMATINGLGAARNILKEGGIKMPFEQGYQEWHESRTTQPKTAVAEVADEGAEEKRSVGRPRKEVNA